MLALSTASCLLFTTHTLISTDTTLNAEHSHENGTGAVISHNPKSVVLSGHNFNINVQSQDNYDLKLSLDNSWGFNHSITSTATLTLNGYTPFPDSDADFLIVFAVGDRQYFSFFTHLDNRKSKNKIYETMSVTQQTQNVSEWISDTITYTQRWDRISNNNQWTAIDEWNSQSLWPLQFVITNNPIQDSAVFHFFHSTPLQFAAGYTLEQSFAANQKMDVYIMGDSSHEQFAVSSVHISLANTPTLSPTQMPTKAANTVQFVPTYKPNIEPTQRPSTLRPTRNIKNESTLIPNTNTNFANLTNQTSEITNIFADTNMDPKTKNYFFIFYGIAIAATIFILLRLYLLCAKYRKESEIAAMKCESDKCAPQPMEMTQKAQNDRRISESNAFGSILFNDLLCNRLTPSDISHILSEDDYKIGVNSFSTSDPTNINERRGAVIVHRPRILPSVTYDTETFAFEEKNESEPGFTIHRHCDYAALKRMLSASHTCHSHTQDTTPTLPFKGYSKVAPNMSTTSSIGEQRNAKQMFNGYVSDTTWPPIKDDCADDQTEITDETLTDETEETFL